MTMKALKEIVQSYLDELEYTRPFVNSDKFTDNSYSKWACKEILREIEKTKDLPFSLEPIELLNSFSEKMKRYAYMNQKNSLLFVIASETAEYLVEQCWISTWKANGRR